MLIDSDVHITPYSEGINTAELIERMDGNGVDKALAWLQPPYKKSIKTYEKCNEYVAKAMQNNPDRVLGFGWIDPHIGIKRSKQLLQKCIEEYEFYGIKLNGAQNDFFIDDPEMSLPLIKEVSKYQKVLALHIGADAYDKTHPFRVGKIADKFPDLTILIVHMGGVAIPYVTEAAIETAENHDNLYLIGSEVGSKQIIEAIEELGPRRVCFGSDTPFEFMDVELARYEVILDRLNGITEDEKNLIMGENISRILGLED